MATEAGPGADYVDASSCAAFRVLFGVVIALSAGRCLAYGWVVEMYETPRFFFTWDGFSWVHPLPAPWMQAIFGLLVLFGALVSMGLCFRITSVLLFLGLSYVQLLDKTNYLNHGYLLCCVAFLVCLLPLERCWSVDAWRRPALRSQRIPAWVPRVLQLQLAVVYIFGGLGKLRPDWILDAQPLRIWLAARSEMPAVGGLLGHLAIARAFS